MSANFSRSFAGVVLAAAFVLCRNGVAAEIPWSSDIEDSLRLAAKNGQPVLMEFTADWCVFCKKMEKNTFTNADVAQRISRNFVAVRVDADQNKDLVKDLGIKGLPAILIVSPDLKVIERISGFQTPEALIPKLDAVVASRPSPGPPATMASAQASVNRSASRSTEKKTIGTETAASSRPPRKELEFEAITQEEAPRAGARPAAKPSRPPVDASKNSIFDAPESRSTPAAKTQTASADGESFFKTISREQPSTAVAPESADPAFGGLCIVSAVDNRELLKGGSRNQIKYRGHILNFTSIENKELFLASPANYWPMLDGVCAMTLIEDQQRVEGSLEFAAMFRKRIWLFKSQEAMQEFLRDPADVAEEATELAAAPER